MINYAKAYITIFWSCPVSLKWGSKKIGIMGGGLLCGPLWGILMGGEAFV